MKKTNKNSKKTIESLPESIYGGKYYYDYLKSERVRWTRELSPCISERSHQPIRNDIAYLVQIISKRIKEAKDNNVEPDEVDLIVYEIYSKGCDMQSIVLLFSELLDTEGSHDGGLEKYHKELEASYEIVKKELSDFGKLKKTISGAASQISNLEPLYYTHHGIEVGDGYFRMADESDTEEINAELHDIKQRLKDFVPKYFDILKSINFTPPGYKELNGRVVLDNEYWRNYLDGQQSDSNRIKVLSLVDDLLNAGYSQTRAFNITATLMNHCAYDIKTITPECIRERYKKYKKEERKTNKPTKKP